MTTNATITTLTRRFKFGATVLDDPDPTAAPLDALRMFTASYPFLATATLDEEPEIAGSVATYTVRKPDIQTKGAGAELNATLKAIDGWSRAPANDPTPSSCWQRAHDLLCELERRPRNPVAEAMNIPLA